MESLRTRPLLKNRAPVKMLELLGTMIGAEKILSGLSGFYILLYEARSNKTTRGKAKFNISRFLFVKECIKILITHEQRVF